MAESNKSKKGLSGVVKFFLGCLGISILGFVVFTALAAKGVSNVANSINEKEEKDSESFNNPKRVGEAVNVKDVQWTVISARDLGSTLKSKYDGFGDDCVADSGKFIQVTVKVKNNSKDMVSATDLYVYDSSKNQYTSSSDVFGCVEEEMFILENINPGIEKTFVGTYEVPHGASGFRVKVGDLDLFSEGHEYVSLGF